ncbi:MAG: polar amino acid transport system permease protein [Gammaproteobacteria bacterium]|jgi:polar amino acid transport system permease protein
MPIWSKNFAGIGFRHEDQGFLVGFTALNMSTFKTYSRVIIPQAIPPAIAGLGNYLVGIFKDTPMLSIIGVAELIHTANAIGSEH